MSAQPPKQQALKILLVGSFGELQLAISFNPPASSALKPALNKGGRGWGGKCCAAAAGRFGLDMDQKRRKSQVRSAQGTTATAARYRHTLHRIIWVGTPGTPRL
jgi:hypothetical protein